MRRSPRRGRARGSVVPFLSGALLGATFQPWGLSLLALVALVPLLWTLRRLAADPGVSLRDAFRAAYAGGVGYFAVMGHWFLLLDAAQLSNRAVMIPLFALLVAYLALYPALFGTALVVAARRTRVSFALLAPPLWVAMEWLRGSGPLGFPWGNVGYALATQPALLQSAAWVGVNGLTLLVVGVNAAIEAALAARGSRGRRAEPLGRALPLAAAAGVVAALHVSGGARLRAYPPTDAPALKVAIVQPNIPTGVKWDWEHKERSVDAVARLLKRAAPGTFDLSVWPETTIPAYLHEEPGYFRLVKSIVERSGAPALFGFPDTEMRAGEREYFNAALLLLPDGTEAGEYRKVRLVPFGEQLPLQSLVPALKRVDFGEADFTPGTEYTQFAIPGGRFGVSICFEAIFPEMTRRLVRDGAEFIVNVTNDAWYGRSSSPWQHARMAIVRAVEGGVSLVRSANTGISLVADPCGRLAAETGLFEEAIVIVPLDTRRLPTFFAAHGDWSLRAALAVSLLALIGAALPIPLLSRR